MSVLGTPEIDSRSADSRIEECFVGVEKSIAEALFRLSGLVTSRKSLTHEADQLRDEFLCWHLRAAGVSDQARFLPFLRSGLRSLVYRLAVNDDIFNSSQESAEARATVLVAAQNARLIEQNDRIIGLLEKMAAK